MYIQPFSMEVDWSKLWWLMEVSVLCFIFAHTAFLLCGQIWRAKYHTASAISPLFVCLDSQSFVEIYLTPWELPADWSKGIVSYFELIRRGVRIK